MKIAQIADKLSHIAKTTSDEAVGNLGDAIRALTVRISKTLTGVYTYADTENVIEMLHAEMVDAGFYDIAESFKSAIFEEYKLLSKHIKFGEEAAKSLSAANQAKLDGWEQISSSLPDFIRNRLAVATVVPMRGDQLVMELLKEFPKLESHAATYISTAQNRQVQEMWDITGNELGTDMWEYVGPDDNATRDFCSELLQQQFFTTEEKEELENDPDRAWGCRHSFIPVSGIS